MDYQKIFNQYLNVKAERKSLLKRLEEEQIRLEQAKKELQTNEDTQQLLFESIKIINQEFKTKLEKTSTLAIRKVFKRNLELKVNYIEKSWGVETQINVIENGLPLDPEDDMGGSIIEVISLIIRLILRDLSKDRSRKTIILDEPFRWSGKLIELIAQIIKEFSEEFGLQFIIVTHDEILEDIADRIFKIERQDKISKVWVT